MMAQCHDASAHRNGDGGRLLGGPAGEGQAWCRTLAHTVLFNPHSNLERQKLMAGEAKAPEDGAGGLCLPEETVMAGPVHKAFFGNRFFADIIR